MPLSSDIMAVMHSGREVAAELPAVCPDYRAYAVVIPQAPSLHQHPEAWLNAGRIGVPSYAPLPTLRDPASIKGYEVRYLSHRAKYTNTDWGLDYDYVLDDPTTRVRRVFVSRVEEIEAALSPWLEDLSQLRPVQEFDSSLVNSPIESYLNRSTERPHLWQ